VIEDLFIRHVLSRPGALHRWFKLNRPLLPRAFDEGGLSYFPDTIFLSINSTCNLKCRMCDVGQENVNSQFYQHLKGPRHQELSLVRLKELVDEVKAFKPLLAVISTEPLLYRDLVPLVAYAGQAGLPVQVTTNGLLLEKFAHPLVEAGLEILWVSLDGPPAVHDSIRGVEGSFERALAGIKAVAEARTLLGRSTPRMHINYTISNLNHHCLEEFMALMAPLPLEQVVFSHLNFVTGEMAERHNRKFPEVGRATSSCVGEVDPLAVDLDLLDAQATRIRREYGARAAFVPDLDRKALETFYRDHGKFVTKDRCEVVWNVAQIIASGDLIPVTRCFNVKLGNINQQPFLDVWLGDEMRRFRRLLAKHKAFPACPRCCGIF